ncbi:MAG: hypothetical protein JW720_15355 [Sedimentisphaerales bacterium]|nr:hypothetical protein [Sedimentisphaerales bacterium]
MASTKKKTSLIGSMVIISVLLSCVWALQTIEIKVSPNVLNILSNGEVVTVHTDIAYSSVVGSTVTLNGVEISHWKSDNRGNFVAKFLMEDIKGLEGLNIGGMNTLTLEGTTAAGEGFSGCTEILVVENTPKK